MPFHLELFLVETYVAIVVTLSRLDVKDWAALATLSWILIQINERRRLNERNIDKFLDKALEKKWQNLREEREQILLRLTTEPQEWVFSRAVRFAHASLKRILVFAGRLLRLQRPLSSTSHAMVLFDSGDKASAQNEFHKHADELLDKSRIYRKYADAKEQEAISALIFSGRVAALRRDGEATIAAFNRALALNDRDPDARKFIGQQFRAAGNLTEALRQFDTIVEAERNGARAAEAFRLKAEIFSDRDEVGNARDALKKSLEIERRRQSYRGIAETEEKLGDVFARRDRTFKAARRSYLASIENYRTSGDGKSVRRVQRKLQALRSEETALSRYIERFGYAFIRLAKRFRGPGNKQ